MTSSEEPTFSVLRTEFPGPSNWYARITWPDSTITHTGEPWNSEWAANRQMELWRQRHYLSMRSHGQIGNGDVCPIDHEHGKMFALPPHPGQPPMQYCPHVSHDGGGPRIGGQAPPRTRSVWPLHGFEESAAAYMARAGLSLPDLEVNLDG